MSSYIEIPFTTENKVNKELKECIMYIGKYYGKNNDDTLKSGIDFLAKKVRGASKRSIRLMIYPKRKRGRELEKWCFKKCSYARVYEYIIYKLMFSDEKGRQKALELLHFLYNQLLYGDGGIEKCFKNILIKRQYEMLYNARILPEYENERKIIEKIKKGIDKCGEKFDKYLLD